MKASRGRLITCFCEALIAESLKLHTMTDNTVTAHTVNIIIFIDEAL